MIHQTTSLTNASKATRRSRAPEARRWAHRRNQDAGRARVCGSYLSRSLPIECTSTQSVILFRALSWLDITKRTGNVCALQYAAHDSRQAIEQLLFEEIVLSVGTALDRKEYEKCRGNSTQLHKILQRLNPGYTQLALFTQALVSMEPQLPSLITWDHKVLVEHWGKVSRYLHWAGEPAETVECRGWITQGIVAVEAAAAHIWDNNRAGYTGIMTPESMQPEIQDCWERFRRGDIDLDAV